MADIYLYDGDLSFVAMHVSSDVTEIETQNLSIRRKSLPDKELHYLTCHPQCNFGTSFVCLNSSLYSIGGSKLSYYCSDYIDEVTVFDTTQTEDKPLQVLRRHLPSLKEERCLAEVVSVDGKIYAFGGISARKEDAGEGVWAEYLEPYSPSLQWKPLPEPPLRILLKDRPFSIMLNDRKIFIGPKDVSKEGLIYDFNKESWEKYKLYSGDLPDVYVTQKPVYVQNDNTMYWLSSGWLDALDLNTGVHFCGDIVDSLLSGMEYILECAYWGPILMHLKNDIFCIFTVYSKQKEEYLDRYGFVECTKFKVSKVVSEAGGAKLDICLLGYQSYKCDPMHQLYGFIPVVKWKSDSQRRKRKESEIR